MACMFTDCMVSLRKLLTDDIAMCFDGSTTITARGGADSSRRGECSRGGMGWNELLLYITAIAACIVDAIRKDHRNYSRS